MAIDFSIDFQVRRAGGAIGDFVAAAVNPAEQQASELHRRPLLESVERRARASAA
jgi:hypothetical protein